MSQPSRDDPPGLEPSQPRERLVGFEFETPAVDRRGEISGRESRRARCLRRDLGSGVSLDLAWIPGGAFEMGSAVDERGRWSAERPRHEVEVPDFLLARHPVTQAQWRLVAGWPAIDRELDPAPSRFEGETLPVENLGWYDAVEFCSRLSEETGRRFRLPSEAEWEYACRAGATTPFHCGETLTADLANYFSDDAYADEEPRTSLGRTTPVGQYPANGFGLHDMHGNVFEWCADAWHPHYDEAPGDGSAWLEDGYPNYRPLRGGAWCTHPQGCRAAYRSAAHQSRDHRLNTYGFRVALSLDNAGRASEDR